ncbi:hypothetical protein QTQ03_19750 [Micromonospora sp. WMMA1363]|uniref:hypothetical protein n=1 Tax=Micromonospora sp. WMMA1363 TaxID=3053985 RepID=UPI00259CDA67|nr:hypothetical protein [Micromonospora sp. WMMA1363]MDM4721715.1 hypothetical protein [Micromonospora sp. WMMA1363]
MTTGGYREVDHDLLADYLGGVLDGTPDEETVARLVDEDSAWAEAYAELAPAVAKVRADLRAWGSPTTMMPTDVTDRIVAALAMAPDVESAGEPNPRPLVPAQPQGGSRRPGGVPRSGGAPTTGPGRRRRRWTRIGAPVALAAVAVATAGLLSLDQLGGEQGTGSAGTGLAATDEVAPAAAPPVRTAAPPLRTGIDYTPQTVDNTTMAQRFSSERPAPPADSLEAQSSRVGGPVGLDRLEDSAALTGCLTEIGAEHRAGPLVVDVVDYARFRGDPALVVWFTDGTGARWAWVSGPECGLPGSGSDNRYRARVG